MWFVCFHSEHQGSPGFPEFPHRTPRTPILMFTRGFLGFDPHLSRPRRGAAFRLARLSGWLPVKVSTSGIRYQKKRKEKERPSWLPVKVSTSGIRYQGKTKPEKTANQNIHLTKTTATKEKRHVHLTYLHLHLSKDLGRQERQQLPPTHRLAMRPWQAPVFAARRGMKHVSPPESRDPILVGR